VSVTQVRVGVVVCGMRWEISGFEGPRDEFPWCLPV